MLPEKKNHQNADGYKPEAVPRALKVIKNQKEATLSMDNFVQSRVVKLRSVELIGFQGDDLEDEHKLSIN